MYCTVLQTVRGSIEPPQLARSKIEKSHTGTAWQVAPTVYSTTQQRKTPPGQYVSDKTGGGDGGGGEYWMYPGEGGAPRGHLLMLFTVEHESPSNLHGLLLPSFWGS